MRLDGYRGDRLARLALWGAPPADLAELHDMREDEHPLFPERLDFAEFAYAPTSKRAEYVPRWLRMKLCDVMGYACLYPHTALAALVRIAAGSDLYPVGAAIRTKYYVFSSFNRLHSDGGNAVGDLLQCPTYTLPFRVFMWSHPCVSHASPSAPPSRSRIRTSGSATSSRRSSSRRR